MRCGNAGTSETVAIGPLRDGSGVGSTHAASGRGKRDAMAEALSLIASGEARLDQGIVRVPAATRDGSRALLQPSGAQG